MHAVLARDTDDEAFAPSDGQRRGRVALDRRARSGLLNRAFDILGTLKTGENEEDDKAVAALTAQQGRR